MWRILSKIFINNKIKNISLKNVIDIVNLSEKYGASELKFYAMKFLLDNKAKIC